MLRPRLTAGSKQREMLPGEMAAAHQELQVEKIRHQIQKSVGKEIEKGTLVGKKMRVVMAGIRQGQYSTVL